MACGLRQRVSIGWCAALLSIAGLTTCLLTNPPYAAAAPCGSYQNGLGGFSSTNLPSACWRPYNDSSPLNRAVPSNPPLAPGSAAVSQALAGLGTPFNIGESRYLDGGHPTFWSQPSDPLVTLHALWSSSPINGMQVRVPAQATPAGGFSFGSNWPDQHDSHMTIVDQASGWEYDLWNTQSMSNGVLTYTNGCRTRIDGSGLGSCGVAANFGNLAGVIRLEELKAGHIDHALVASVPCVNGHAYPVLDDNNNCGPGSGTPKLGAHLWLDMTPAEIDALPIPAYRKTIAKALAKYGAYVEDSGNDHFGFNIESPQTYASFGHHDWTDWAASVGGSSYNTPDGMPAWHLSLDGIPLSSRLRVLDPCTADGSCPASTTPPTDPGSPSSPSETQPAGTPVSLSGAGTPTSSVPVAGSGNETCWSQRAAWARAYRRTHDSLGPRFRRSMARMAQICRNGDQIPS